MCHFGGFCIHLIFSHLQSDANQVPSREPTVRPSRGHRKALMTFQRGRRCNPTSAPLRPREGPVARRRPLFCAFRSVKKPRNFAVPMSRKALTASQALLSGSQRGLSAAAATTNKGLIAHGKSEKRRVRKSGFCKKRLEQDSVAELPQVGSRPVATASLTTVSMWSISLYARSIRRLIMWQGGGRDRSRPYLWEFCNAISLQISGEPTEKKYATNLSHLCRKKNKSVAKDRRSCSATPLPQTCLCVVTTRSVLRHTDDPAFCIELDYRSVVVDPVDTAIA